MDDRRWARIGDLKFGSEEKEALQRVIDSGRISEGPEVRAFEDEFAQWVGVRHCVAVSSGTAALICGLKSLILDRRFMYVQEGDAVLIPALTFIATANAVKLCGLEPVFGDINPDTFCLEPGAMLWSHCNVVMPVHLMGYMADMKEFVDQASWYVPQVTVVEDAAEAHGSVQNGKKAGSFGVWSAFSFYIAHTVQAGELGCVCTDDAKIAQFVRRLKAHGRVCSCRKCTRTTTGCEFLVDGDPRFTHLFPGYNFKTMEFQAALARVQLSKVDANIGARRTNVLRLSSRLACASDDLILPKYDENVAPMGYPIVLRNGGAKERAVMMMELEQNSVECRPLFGCIPTQQPAYAGYKEAYKDRLPVAEKYGASGFYVGCHQYLDYRDIDHIVRIVLSAMKGIRDGGVLGR